MIEISSELYPNLLKNIYDPPHRLFYRGNLDLLNKSAISIVGTRSYSEYGKSVCKKIIEELSILDIVIVSGLAIGIDAIAHSEALKNGLPTIAVLGSGINNIYPVANAGLAEKISNRGLIISEYPGSTEAQKYHFPKRNRIVSGLSIATLVIEAPLKSGALITARMALEQGREVFVVPGDIEKKNSEGILDLLQKGGAYPIKSGREIIELLNLVPAKKPKLTEVSPLLKLNNLEKLVIASISAFRKTSISQVLKKTGLSIEQILSILSILEVKGLIRNLDGKYLRLI
ncbi:DNA-protecting protein DprA [Candidatus Peregrinibacteria bacterium]|nr:DNA-protecting protein DprA [Candidatus Peregrinibacteria bacterium]